MVEHSNRHVVWNIWKAPIWYVSWFWSNFMMMDMVVGIIFKPNTCDFVRFGLSIGCCSSSTTPVEAYILVWNPLNHRSLDSYFSWNPLNIYIYMNIWICFHIFIDIFLNDSLTKRARDLWRVFIIRAWRNVAKDKAPIHGMMPDLSDNGWIQ